MEEESFGHLLRMELAILAGSTLHIPDQKHFLLKKLGDPNGGHRRLKEQGLFCRMPGAERAKPTSSSSIMSNSPVAWGFPSNSDLHLSPQHTPVIFFFSSELTFVHGTVVYLEAVTGIQK